MKNIKYVLTVQLLILFNISLIAQSQYNSFAYQNYSKTHEILNSSIKKHGILDTKRGIKLEMVGRVLNEGHPYYPDSLVSSNIIGSCTYQNGNIDEQVTFKRENSESQGKGLIMDGRCFFLARGGQFFNETIPENFNKELGEYTRYLPQMILEEAESNAKTLNYLGQDDLFHIISYVNINNEVWQMYINKEDYLLQRLTKLYFDDRMGDSYETIEFDAYKKWDNLMLPTRFKQFRLGQPIRDLDISYAQIKEKMDWNLPDSIQMEDVTKLHTYKITTDSIFINPIVKDLYEILLPQTNNRLLLALFDNYSVLLEGSYHSRHGDLVIKKIEEKFPDKPVKYFSYSHIHHQYIGFVRSIAANEGTVIIPESHHSLIEKMINSKHTLNPDKQAEVNHALKYALFDKKYSLKDKNHQLNVYNIGPLHTADYLVFYFPKEKFLFVGDQLWVDEDESKNLSGRAFNLYKKLEELNLDIDQMTISWPVTDYKIKNYVDYQEFKEKGKLAEMSK